MVLMALTTLLGAATVILSAFYIQHRAAAERRATNAAVQEEVQDKLKRAKALDSRLAQDLLALADIDAAIDDFTKDRLTIHALPTEKGWLWTSDDLGKWSKARLG